MKKHLNKYVIALIVITGFHCAAAAVVPFVALIGASPWKNVSDTTNTFFFFNIQDSTSKSSFDGNENLPVSGQASFTGGFDNHNIHFTYDSNTDTSRAGKTYAGTINDASTVITLKGTDANKPLPPLTLKKS